MPRRELFREAKGAFVFLYIYLIFFCLTALLMIAGGLGARELALLLVFFLAAAAEALWVKRNVVWDLWAGRTETVCGRVVLREVAGSFKFLQVEYLSLDTQVGVRRLVLFHRAPALGLIGGQLVLQYLPKSGIVIQLEELEGAAIPPHRSRAWYREKFQRERERTEQLKPVACLWRRSFWFWEELPALGGLLLFVIGFLCKTVCKIP